MSAEQIMPADKYLSIFSRQMATIVFTFNIREIKDNIYGKVEATKTVLLF